MNPLLVALVVISAIFSLGVMVLSLAFCRSAGLADRRLEELSPTREFENNFQEGRNSILQQAGKSGKERPHIALQNN